MTSSTSRRTVIGGAAAVGAGAMLAACGGKPKAPTFGGPVGTPVSKIEDVPVGGGAINRQRRVVVTQPSEGDFKAFSAVCTHRSCIVTSVQDDVIHCACHGSAFSIFDGSVVNGPATEPLAAQPVEVDGAEIVLTEDLRKS